jgi:hypothetical protein
MAISYEFEIEGDLLKVSTRGKDDHLQDVQSYGMAVLEKALQSECTKIFCDERELEYKLSFVDHYQLAEVASQYGRVLKKIAIVCDQKFVKEGEFFETVAKNRGLSVFLTADYEQALDWLS